MSSTAATLYLVATPIGNLGDITLRALEVLRNVDRVAAEDTRRTRQLLAHFSIEKPLLSLHEHNERERIPQVLNELAAGQSLALVSDAGTPLISDPGFPLVRAVRAAGYPVVPIPGASSVLAALCASGLATDRFVFEGFLPAKPGTRRERIKALQDETRTLILFESSHRIEATLHDLAAGLGAQRLAVIARELTKLYEQIHAAPLGELVTWLQQRPEHQRGEFVLVLEGAPPVTESALNPELERLLKLLLSELPTRQAVDLCARYSGYKKNALYEHALKLQSAELAPNGADSRQ